MKNSSCLEQSRMKANLRPGHRRWVKLTGSLGQDGPGMTKAIHAQEDRGTALEKAQAVAQKLESMKLQKAAKIVREGAVETVTFYAYPREHWWQLRTNNPLERILKEIRRRTRVVGSFPEGESALMLASARLRHVAGTRWGSKRYMDMGRLQEAEREQVAVAG